MLTKLLHRSDGYRYTGGLYGLLAIIVLGLVACGGASSSVVQVPACAPSPTPAATPTININVNSYSIAVGPDGAIWAHVTIPPDYHDEIHRFLASGGNERVDLPFISGGVFGMFTGPDHNLWFASNDKAGSALVRRNAAGQFTTFGFTTHSCLTGTTDEGPFNITQGPDGALWFTQLADSRIGRITTQGTITEYALPAPFVNAFDITSGADGNLWFTDELGGNVGRITPQGQVTAFPLVLGTHPYGIAAGADGNVWFAEAGYNRLGKITPTGQITEYPLPTANSLPVDLVKGTDGNIWFTELQGNQIGRITPTGQVTEYPTHADHGQPNQIVLGPEGTLWFSSNGDVFRMRLDGTPLALVNGAWTEMHA